MLMLEACHMRTARGKLLWVSKHAFHGMNQERPPVTVDDLVLLLEEPDHDAKGEVRKWIGGRTVRAYYSEDQDGIHLRGVSATRSDRV